MATGSTGGRRSTGQGGSRPFTLGITLDGANETLAAFKALPKQASAELRDRTVTLTQSLADHVAAAGRGQGRQAAKLASTVKVKRDRVPAFEVGGTKKIFRGKLDGSEREAFQPLFGSEFGSNRGHGFAPHAGKRGLWVWPTVEAHEAEIARAWAATAQEIIDKFTEET